jgi:hypothetical protein
MEKYEHNQIQTDNKQIEIGRNYSYFEEFPNAIACVEAIEDNSDKDFIKFKLKIVKGIHSTMIGKEGQTFDVSAKRGLYAYPGMWRIRNFNMPNIVSAMSPAKTPVIEMEHWKSVCKPYTGSCCRYLIMGSDGFECARLGDEEILRQIDERADAGKMNATGKNCEGYGKEKTGTEGNSVAP